MTTEISVTCVFFLIEYGDSVVLVTLTATFLSSIVDVEWEISRLAASIIFCNGVTLTVVFHSEGWSTKAVIVFVVLGGIVGSWSMKTSWGFALVSLEAILSCIVRCGNFMRLCIGSMTKLLFLLKCKPMIGKHYEKIFRKSVVSIIKYKCGCRQQFLKLTICYL